MKKEPRRGAGRNGGFISLTAGNLHKPKTVYVQGLDFFKLSGEVQCFIASRAQQPRRCFRSWTVDKNCAVIHLESCEVTA